MVWFLYKCCQSVVKIPAWNLRSLGHLMDWFDLWCFDIFSMYFVTTLKFPFPVKYRSVQIWLKTYPGVHFLCKIVFGQDSTCHWHETRIALAKSWRQAFLSQFDSSIYVMKSNENRSQIFFMQKFVKLLSAEVR